MRARSCPYCSRWRSPRNSAPARALAFALETIRLCSVAQQRLDGRPEGREICRVGHEQAVRAADDLVDDSADGARDDRPRLPHRLRDGEPEPLGDALLDDDGCVALEGVDDRRRLVGVGHRCAGEVHAAARGVGQSPPELDALLEHLGGLGIVRDPRHRRPGQQEVRAEGGIHVLGEAAHHAGHVLHAVPARDLDDDRRIRPGRRPGLQHVDAAVDAAGRAVAAGEWDRRAALRRLRSGRCSRGSGGRFAARSARSWPRTGRSTAGSRAASIRRPRRARRPRRENTNASTSSRYGRRNDHERSVHSFGSSTPTWHRQTTFAPAPASRRRGRRAGGRGSGRRRSAGRARAARRRSRAASARSVFARPSPSAPPSPGEP